MQTLAVPAWLADGGLLLATWEGTVCRLDKNYAEQWRTRLTPATVDMRGKILADDRTPTSEINTWGNATETARGSVGEPAGQDDADRPPGHLAGPDVADRDPGPEGRHALRRQARRPGRGVDPLAHGGHVRRDLAGQLPADRRLPHADAGRRRDAGRRSRSSRELAARRLDRVLGRGQGAVGAASSRCCPMRPSTRTCSPSRSRRPGSA